MKSIETSRFGTIEYKEDDVISFEKGIPGFEQEKQFILFQPEGDNPIAFLQSIQNKELMFVIANPFQFYPNYQFDLDDISVEELGVQTPDELLVWGILSVPENFQDTTINLTAPLLVNIKNKKGKQYILNDSNYQTRTPLFPHLVTEGGK